MTAGADVPKVEPTRRHFAALIAGLKTAEECARVVERERDALAARVDSLEARIKELEKDLDNATRYIDMLLNRRR